MSEKRQEDGTKSKHKPKKLHEQTRENFWKEKTGPPKKQEKITKTDTKQKESGVPPPHLNLTAPNPPPPDKQTKQGEGLGEVKNPKAP